MADKMAEVLEQYGVHITSATRGRGAYFCHSPEGYFKLEPFARSEGRLEKEYLVKEQLYEAGFTNIDRYKLLEQVEENEEEGSLSDSLIGADRYRNAYVLKTHFEGHECDLKNEAEVLLAMENLSHMHSLYKKKDIIPKSIDNMERHNRELRRVRGYVTKVNQKREFELLYISLFSKFMDKALFAERMLKESKACYHEERFGFCHGAYHHHNVLIVDKEGKPFVATVAFDNYHFDNQLLDVYYFTRKLLEKNHFEYDCFKKALTVYEEENSLDIRDYTYLYLLFSYPEKFWKLSNHYMNNRKSWIPPRSMEKLEGLVKLEEQKDIFLQKLAEDYGIHIS